jgi:hypothetical protein
MIMINLSSISVKWQNYHAKWTKRFNSILLMGKTKSRYEWLNHDEFIIKHWSEDKLSCLMNNLIQKMLILYHRLAEIKLMLSKLTQ